MKTTLGQCSPDQIVRIPTYDDGENIFQMYHHDGGLCVVDLFDLSHELVDLEPETQVIASPPDLSIVALDHPVWSWGVSWRDRQSVITYCNQGAHTFVVVDRHSNSVHIFPTFRAAMAHVGVV